MPLTNCLKTLSTAVALVGFDFEKNILEYSQRFGVVFAAFGTRNHPILATLRAIVNLDFADFCAPWDLGFFSDVFYYLVVWGLGGFVT